MVCSRRSDTDWASGISTGHTHEYRIHRCVAGWGGLESSRVTARSREYGSMRPAERRSRRRRTWPRQLCASCTSTSTAPEKPSTCRLRPRVRPFSATCGTRCNRFPTAKRSATPTSRNTSASPRLCVPWVGAANGQNPIPIVIPCHRVNRQQRQARGIWRRTRDQAVSAWSGTRVFVLGSSRFRLHGSPWPSKVNHASLNRCLIVTKTSHRGCVHDARTTRALVTVEKLATTAGIHSSEVLCTRITDSLVFSRSRSRSSRPRPALRPFASRSTTVFRQPTPHAGLARQSDHRRLQAGSDRQGSDPLENPSGAITRFGFAHRRHENRT